ncbi:hypothetical protein GCM10010336_60320 [Streptomyces goshikiensis]|nr:hypothetical protein GCM10010336_60320 [Streptomyces goshikiensis]
MHPVAVPGRGDRLGEGGVPGDGVEQSVQAHEGGFRPVKVQREGPDTSHGPGVPTLRRRSVTRAGDCGPPQE